MFLVGDGHVHIYEGDSLVSWDESPEWEKNAFDYIMTNPPMGRYDGDANINNFTFTNEQRYELLFTENVIKAAKPDIGNIAIVLNDGSLETPSRSHFREKILQSCNLYAIISLTKFAFAPYTKEKTYVLFMQKKDIIDPDNIQNPEFQKYPIWHYILDYDGYANSDKRFKTKYHDDLIELESLFPNAIDNAKIYLKDPSKFEQEKMKYERDVNEREKSEGLSGKKCGYVQISDVNKSNLYNLLSEFHLRPTKFKTVTQTDFLSDTSGLLRKIKSLNGDNLQNLISQLTNISQLTKIEVHAGKSKKISELFEITGGNPGLTEEFIYYNKPSEESEGITILSSATLNTNLMGDISQNARPNNNDLKIFEGPSILVARNGYAGKMTYIATGKFTTNNHAYVLTLKDGWKDKINLRWFAYQYQELFYNLVTSKSDNATFNKEYAEEQVVIIPNKNAAQEQIAAALLEIDSLLLSGPVIN